MEPTISLGEFSFRFLSTVNASREGRRPVPAGVPMTTAPPDLIDQFLA